MNAIETAVMNNPARRAVQRFYEAPLLRRLGGDVEGGAALEIGCGQGYGAELICRVFRAAHVDAIDIDPGMLERARRRARRKRLPVTVRRADATRVPAPDGAYDAVFDFGIVHHVEDWPAAVAEVRRVLRPGGQFFFEEVTAKALARPSYRLLFDHPRADRFSAAELVAELDRNGLRVDGRVVERFFGDFVIGVARAAT